MKKAGNEYLALKKRHQEEVNNFPLGFAFGETQWQALLEQWGIEEKDTKAKIYSIGNGGFLRKADAPAFKEIYERHDKELSEGLKSFDFAYAAMLYELGNHEYCVTYDPTDALEALGLEMEDLADNATLRRAFAEAKFDYFALQKEA